jgi:amino acid transporter
MMIIQFLTGMPGVCYALANYLLPYLGFPQENRWVVLVTVCVLVLIAFINHRGITLASLVNNVSVAAEILGTVVAGVLLLWLAMSRHVNPWSFLLARSPSASVLEYLQGFALSSVLSAWTLTGFETAANLAEETHNPQGFVPKAIVYSELSSVAIGFLVLVGFTMAIPSLDATRRSETPLLLIMQSHLTPLATHLIMAFVFISIFASALANLTTLSRMVWAMARDHELPVSRWLSHVSAHGVPTTAIWVVTLLSVLFALWAKLIIVMTGTASLAGYITYALIVGAAVWAARKRWPPEKDMQAGEGGTRRAPNTPILPRGLTAATLVWLVTILAMLSLPGSVRRNVLVLGATILAGALCYRLRGGRRERTD